jgi:hypothetical protein
MNVAFLQKKRHRKQNTCGASFIFELLLLKVTKAVVNKDDINPLLIK